MRVSARHWGAARGWSCGCSASLSRGPGAGVVLEQPQDHRHGPQRTTYPSQPGLGVVLPCQGSKGGAGNAGGTLPDSGAGQGCTSLCLAHPSRLPRVSWGTAFKFSLPESYSSAAASPCTGNTIPANFPADFPASPSPACVCNYCAWQLLPSVTAPCPGCYSSSPASQGLGEQQLCQAESPGTAAAQLGLGGTGQLHGHWTAREWPLDSQRDEGWTPAWLRDGMAEGWTL